MQPLRDMVLRAGQVGIRQAYLETMGLVVDPTDKRHLDDVSNELLFRHYVRHALEILGVPTDRQEVIGRRVSVDDCPGFWLARAVHLEARRAEPEPAASNSYDMDHVLYAPYADAFFTDKRIASYINAIRRRATPPVRVSQMPTAVSTAADVIAIISAIQAVSTT